MVIVCCFSAVIQRSSNFGRLLFIACALGVVIRDAHSGHGILADEVEQVAQGAVHAVFEAPAQTHIEQWVEATVEICQADG